MVRYDLSRRQPMALTVASSDAPADVKALADFTCDGTDDQVTINAAVDAADGEAGRGAVQLSGGRFYASAQILRRSGVWLRGCGMITEVRAVGITGTNLGLFMPFDNSLHMSWLSDMFLNGNFAAGGNCSAVADNLTGGVRSSYPDSNPDPNNAIFGLYFDNFKGNPNRHGIWAAGDNRGYMVHHIQGRDISGYGIYIQGPDSHWSDIHVGGCELGGFNVNGGNNKLTSCKAFYCDVGFVINSQRGALVACEAQDNRTDGFRFLAGRTTAAGLIADSNANPGGSGASAVAGGSGIVIASSYNSIMGVSSFDRAANATAQEYGVRYTSGDHNQIVGTSQSNSVADTVGSFAGTGNFVRVSGSAGLTSVG